MWIVKIYWKKNVWIVDESLIFIRDEMSRHNSLTQSNRWVGLGYIFYTCDGLENLSSPPYQVEFWKKLSNLIHTNP